MSKIINFGQKKEEIIEDKRKSFERVVFQKFLGSYAVVEDSQGHGGITPINILDISYDGMQFETSITGSVEKAKPAFTKDQMIALRFYFTESSYIPVEIRIAHCQVDGAKKVIRFGAQFNREHSSFEALSAFIHFVYQFAKHSKLDTGDAKVYFL